jgi:hypothetical protein
VSQQVWYNKDPFLHKGLPRSLASFKAIKWDGLSDETGKTMVPCHSRCGAIKIPTGCCSLVVVLSLSKREVVSSSSARAGCVKPKTIKIGSDCSFAKSTAVKNENHGSFGYDLENGGPVLQ